jgi:hypothetical protein
MKVAIAHNSDKQMVPLEMAEYITIFDDSDNTIKEYENDGYGSKEATMGEILRFEPDTVAVKEGILCPGSYMMSRGLVKYAMVKDNSLEEIIKNKEFSIDIKDDLPEEVYAEND